MLYSTVMQMSKIVYLASEYSVQFLFNIAIFQKGYTMTLRWYPIPQKIPRRGLCPQYLQYSIEITFYSLFPLSSPTLYILQQQQCSPCTTVAPSIVHSTVYSSSNNVILPFNVLAPTIQCIHPYYSIEQLKKSLDSLQELQQCIVML